ncbi:MAG: sporulation peptidase YabG, partial [Peptostreptococcaceae bacterium]
RTNMKIGDVVARKSYNKDVIFKIVGFSVDENNEKIALLKGVAFRIIADSYIDDLEIVKMPNIKEVLIDKNVEILINKSMRKAKERQKRMNRGVPKLQTNTNIFGMPG